MTMSATASSRATILMRPPARYGSRQRPPLRLRCCYRDACFASLLAHFHDRSKSGVRIRREHRKGRTVTFHVMRFNDLLQQAIDAGASDIHLHVPLPVMMRVSGKLTPINDVQLTPRATEALIELMCNEQHKEQFEAKQQVDLAYSVPGMGRFRVNLFRQRGSVSAVLRKIGRAHV